MKRTENRYRLKAFTLAEMLVTLALTSVVIAMCYASLAYVQKMLVSYSSQNGFIAEHTRLKQQLQNAFFNATLIEEQGENDLIFHYDSSTALLSIESKVILLCRAGRCDTFHLAAKNILKNYALISNPVWANRLISTLQFETAFGKQTFYFTFDKQYEAATRLILNAE